MQKNITPDEHPFLTKPHRTMLALSFPALLSLIAEPVTGLVDTAFISRLGTSEMAALGVATAALSGVFWIFNFLSVGAQTGVAQNLGRQRRDEAIKVASLATMLAAAFSLTMMILGFLVAPKLAALLGADGTVLNHAVSYINVRLIGTAAVLFTLVGFGVLRGMQDMKTPLYIAVAINILNVVLDYPLIFGLGAIPRMGVAGSALATVISQWIGTVWVIYAIAKKLGYTRTVRMRDAISLIQIGGDLFVRTGLLILFLVLATRSANQISVQAGAAHQAIRQLWMVSTFVLEAYAMTAQSLVGYFVGAERIPMARRVAAYSTWWTLGTGIVLAGMMLAGTQGVIALLVPDSATDVFIGGWIVAALMQPLSGLAFVTDGIHWGTGDYGYMRNGMITATLAGGTMLFMINSSSSNAFMLVWLATVLWIAVRSLIGIVRVWPGIGNSPLRPPILIAA